MAQLKNVTSNGEIIDIENQECGSPEQFDNWHEYTVKHFYSLFNPATKETYTQVEVKHNA